MKMNQTVNRFTAILLALLLFTGNAGMLSAVAAEELPCDPGVTSESMFEDAAAAYVSGEDSEAGTFEDNSAAAMSGEIPEAGTFEENSAGDILEESSASTDIPCQEPGDMGLEEFNGLYSGDDHGQDPSYNREPLAEEAPDPSYKESAFLNEAYAFGNEGSAFADNGSAFGSEESAFADNGSAFGEEMRSSHPQMKKPLLQMKTAKSFRKIYS